MSATTDPADHPAPVPLIVGASFAVLTPAQLTVAKALALGFTCKEIAEQQGISQKTIDTHRGQILKRLGLTDHGDGTTRLARLAIREGLVPL